MTAAERGGDHGVGVDRETQHVPLRVLADLHAATLGQDVVSHRGDPRLRIGATP